MDRLHFNLNFLGNTLNKMNPAKSYPRKSTFDNVLTKSSNYGVKQVPLFKVNFAIHHVSHFGKFLNLIPPSSSPLPSSNISLTLSEKFFFAQTY